ncbi:UDP-N-acetylglucosamine 2-epimerase [Tardiphaga sp. 866_E4_N2_1]|uniref:UDP-N-acetylglucosamine 2-epimerase n=1 Tax=unclassified Tardiphaga TaxID=2631404 RepID=UPI003F206CC0
MKRRICVVTGTRADYGLLVWLLRDIVACPDVELQIVATAMHLEPAFGNTVDQIRKDGFVVDAEVPMDLSDDSPVAIAKATGRGVSGLAEAFDRLQPDIVVLLGDRFEMLAAATAATLLRLPIAHIHGGEISEGAIDDAMRHAISKLSHLHFVAAKEFGDRVVQMGEAPERVFVVGAPGLDHLARSSLPSADELAQRVGLALDRPLILVTYHPATLGGEDPVADLEELLAALDRFPDAALVFTKANADAGGRAINARLEDYVARSPANAVLVASLGSEFYFTALRAAAAVVGNSSSGIIEAPAVGVPTVNIGSRQDGRPRSPSVIDCPDERHAIEAAIRRALDPTTRELARAQTPAYGRAGNSAPEILRRLRDVPLDGILIKRFHDGGGESVAARGHHK